MKLLLVFVLFIPSLFFAQKVLVLGKSLPLKTPLIPIEFIYQDSLKNYNLLDFKAVFIFSTAQKTLTEELENDLISYLQNGGKLYLGSENSPFNVECNELLFKLYHLQSYGNFENDVLTIDSNSNFELKKTENYQSGNSTVSFPLDYRFKVEAWSQDNPIILSSSFGKGKLVIDGGYSRFYELEKSEEILTSILLFLLKD